MQRGEKPPPMYDEAVQRAERIWNKYHDLVHCRYGFAGWARSTPEYLTELHHFYLWTQRMRWENHLKSTNSW